MGVPRPPNDALAQVTVVRLGTQRLARVLVEFTDEAFEGRQEWMLPARLKAHWEHASEPSVDRLCQLGWLTSSSKRQHEDFSLIQEPQG